MNIITIGPIYIRRWVGGAQSKVGVGKITQKVEFTVAMMSTCRHKRPVIHYKAKTDVHWQWEQHQVTQQNYNPPFWCHFTSLDLHGCKKHYGEADQST